MKWRVVGNYRHMYPKILQVLEASPFIPLKSRRNLIPKLRFVWVASRISSAPPQSPLLCHLIFLIFWDVKKGVWAFWEEIKVYLCFVTATAADLSTLNILTSVFCMVDRLNKNTGTRRNRSSTEPSRSALGPRYIPSPLIINFLMEF